jgi:hypothetical protein
MILHHIGYVANDLNLALNALSLKVTDVIDEIADIEQQNMIYVLPGKQSVVWNEIVVPMGKTSTVYNALKHNHFVLHHVAFQVDDIDGCLSLALESPGTVRLGSYKLFIPSFGGAVKTQFYFSSGALFELVQVL